MRALVKTVPYRNPYAAFRVPTTGYQMPAKVDRTLPRDTMNVYRDNTAGG